MIKFKPFGKKYDFKENILTCDYPEYMTTSLKDWLWDVLKKNDKVATANSYLTHNSCYIKPDFLNILCIKFREKFPQEWSSFIIFTFQDSLRTSNILAFFLQNFANGYDANQLEYFLSEGGSAYEVILSDKKTSEYDKGVYNLIERVPEVVKKQSNRAISDNDLLQEAWTFCYSINPDYEKVVTRCCDFLETYFKKIYFLNDPKPQLKKFIHSFETTPNVLSYKGDSIVEPKSNLTSLLKEASNIRGQHTGGQGRKPTKPEAEFVLHTTIYIWNLHQK